MKTVLAHGCWDILHLGHILHLKSAKEMGDHLTVSVTADEFVNKGMGRPHFTAEQRAEVIRSLACVDSVQINRAPNAVPVIKTIRPDIYVKGVDYAGEPSPGLQEEIDAVRAFGGEVRFTATQKLSSSRLINAGKFSDETLIYLDDLRIKKARDKILKAFEAADKKKILFVGESIIDKYIYVQGLGRASKELMLATVVTESEEWHGGVWAAAEHGEWPNQHVLTAPIHITKTRYVDGDFKRKILDVYSDRALQLSEFVRDEFRAKLQDAVQSVDVVITLDFGHGLLGQMERHILMEHSPWLAVNAQTNAGNYGFNPVTNYLAPHYVCVDEPEARLAVQDQFSKLPKVLNQLQLRQRCFRYLITRGRNGSSWARSGMYGDAPALADGGVDTMGAGDAVMAVTAPLVSTGLEMEMAAFVGNIVGAIKIATVGHRTHVKRNEIIQTVEALLA